MTRKPRSAGSLVGLSLIVLPGALALSVLAARWFDPPSGTAAREPVARTEEQPSPGPPVEALEPMAQKPGNEALAAVAPQAPRDPLYDLDVEPHPQGPERDAMAAQHALFGEVGEAIERGDLRQARTLLAQHEARFAGPESWQDQREGYARVLDCLEVPGAESRARGAAFIESERLSPLRRRVRRTCLEGRPFSGRR